MRIRYRRIHIIAFLSTMSLSLSASSCLLKDCDQIRIAIFGDSITEQGDQLPNGYVNVLRNMLLTKNPQIRILASGVSGDKVIDLKNRLNSGVVSINHSIVIIYIGVNDILHQKYADLIESSPENFRITFRAILLKARDAGARVIVCTPAVVGEKINWSQKDWEPRKSYWPWRPNPKYGDAQLSNMLNLYSDIIRQLAKESGLTIVDLQKEFYNYLIKNNSSNQYSGILTNDGVHLNDRGNQFVASLIENALDLSDCR